MEISLAIDTPDGVVLVVGCSHPTIEKIVETARSVIEKPIHLIVGGTHLLPATPDEISRIATTLRDDWKVEWIAPVHCTGEPAFAILKESFGDRYLYAGLGTTLELGPKVTTKAEAGQPQMYAMSLEDVIDYRVALAHQMLNALAVGRMRLASAQQ
jgi:7,8-dihydropterin-6-yl-methyl-4-(beta-D-ribofuranosyl)aminobenzene 5'-phosphate synthase